jgi:hypothetical protein
VTKLERFEASYRTRGDLMVTMFQAKNGLRCAVSSGRVGPITAFLDPETAAKLRDAVASAKERLDSIRKQ